MFSSSSFKVLPLLIGITILCVSILPSQAGANCSAHQYYSGGRCEECDATCDECTSFELGYCSNCTDGYRNSSSTGCSFSCPSTSQFINFNTQTCDSCASWCPRGCIEARDICNNCTTYYRPDLGNCNSTCPQYGGFYASSFENRCVPCRDLNCLRCKKNGDCEECKSFWNLNTTTGRCSRKCSTGCKLCTERGEIGVCLECETGWNMTSSGSCTCPYRNCRECGSTSCARCEEGYIKDASGVCKSTVPNCRQYNSTTTCEMCEPGYYLWYNNCYQCKTGCRHCVTTSGNCTACENGYYLNTTYSTLYPTCLLKTSKPPTPTPGPTPDPYRPSSNSGWIIALLIGGVIIILIIVSVIVAQAKKKRQAAAAQLDESGASAVAYAQINSNATSTNPAFQQPGGYSTQQIYPADQKDRESNYYFPGN